MGYQYEELPDDLFIPPNALEICLESFSGPLDLLLYLIKKENINILDLDVSKITDQYLEYIELMDSLKFDLAADYLVMAATLAEIKSRLMLPTESFDEEAKLQVRNVIAEIADVDVTQVNILSYKDPLQEDANNGGKDADGEEATGPKSGIDDELFFFIPV